MSLLDYPDYEVVSESDVEQKLIYPLLTHPTFLDIPARNILSKRSLSSFSFVDKSSLPKNYVPDYLISLLGFPLCVVEAKSPDEDARQAVAEARLYAQTLNAQFPSGLNPIQVAIGCNGRELHVGPWDSSESASFAVEELIVGSGKLTELRSKAGVAALLDRAKGLQRVRRSQSAVAPSRRLDSGLFLERIKPNSLAPYLSPLYEMFFRAEDPEKIQLILEKAYVDTAELREYDQVLHTMLRQIERSHAANYQTIQTDRKREYTLSPELTRYQDDIAAQGRLHLIIGSRGSGKSLFIARFFSHLIPDALREHACWCVLDFNKAPSTIENVEDFICQKFASDIRNLRFDPYDMDGLTRIFSVELSRLKKGPLAGISDAQERQKLIAAELLRLSSDQRTFALKLARHLTGEANIPVIVAFDNVDRRSSNLQLSIFQAAQWFRSETRAFALLTLRDATFERYKKEPPLDAFAQISNFYIRPPRFSLVLQKRLALAIDEGLKQIPKIEQVTAGGSRITYTKAQLTTFLRAVYAALFSSENQVGQVVDALAERDVREALGLFARILASGHFNADRVIGIGVGGSAKISDDLLLKVLMRGDYRLYSEEAGFIFNVFWTPTESWSGNIFLLGEVLGFFAQEARSGRDKISGYWRVEELISDLVSMGFTEDEIRAAAQHALEKKLVTYDGEDSGTLTDTDLIKISPSGFIHLRSMPHFIEYLASVALHSAISDAQVTRRIADTWSRTLRYADLTFSAKHEVASLFSTYLVREKAKLDSQNPLFKERAREAEGLVRATTHTVNVTQAIADRLQAKAKARQVQKAGHPNGKSSVSYRKR